MYSSQILYLFVVRSFMYSEKDESSLRLRTNKLCVHPLSISCLSPLYKLPQKRQQPIEPLELSPSESRQKSISLCPVDEIIFFQEVRAFWSNHEHNPICFVCSRNCGGGRIAIFESGHFGISRRRYPGKCQ